MRNKKFISIYFDDEIPLLQAVRKLRENKEIIIDVQSPFPVHGLDHALAMKRTRIPVGGFICGLIGVILAFGFQAWVFTVSYPLIIGGKPFFSLPAFIPITFEVAVLFGGLAMVAALLIKSRLKPDLRFEPFDENITDDTFVIFIESEEGQSTIERVRSALSDIQTLKINYSEQMKSDI